MPIELLAVVLVVAAVVVAVPVRRLVLSGFSRGAIVAYAIVLLLLAVGVTEARPLARVLLPILGLLYIAPFFTFRGGLDRLLGRDPRPVIRVTPVDVRGLQPPRDVTPPDARQPSPDDRDAASPDERSGRGGPGGPTTGPLH